MTRVYLDTVITSGRVSKDLQPPAEMAAVEEIERFRAESCIKIVTSKMSGIEQARTTNPIVRAAFEEHAHEVSVVQNDHRLLGFNSVDQGRYGFISSPMVSDIVDEELFAKLIAAGLQDADAKHVMYAVANDCQVFVTLDTKDLLRRRSAVEAICQHLRILKPTELVAELIAR